MINGIFRCKNPMRQNLSPQVWGRHGWDFLEHCLYAYDATSRIAYLQLLHLLPSILPCESCREHAALYLVKNPPEDAADLRQWLAVFRDAVAERVKGKRPSDRLPDRIVALLCVLVMAVVVATALQAGLAQR